MYCIRLDVTGELMALPPSCLEPFAYSTRDEDTSSTLKGASEREEVQGNGVHDLGAHNGEDDDEDDLSDGGDDTLQLFHTLDCVGVSRVGGDPRAEGPVSLPLCDGCSDEMRNSSFFATPPTGMCNAFCAVEGTGAGGVGDKCCDGSGDDADEAHHIPEIILVEEEEDEMCGVSEGEG